MKRFGCLVETSLRILSEIFSPDGRRYFTAARWHVRAASGYVYDVSLSDNAARLWGADNGNPTVFQGHIVRR
jgi:hypothetical protein